jgi:hypothetical protein
MAVLTLRYQRGHFTISGPDIEMRKFETRREAKDWCAQHALGQPPRPSGPFSRFGAVLLDGLTATALRRPTNAAASNFRVEQLAARSFPERWPAVPRCCHISIWRFKAIDANTGAILLSRVALSFQDQIRAGLGRESSPRPAEARPPTRGKAPGSSGGPGPPRSWGRGVSDNPKAGRTRIIGSARGDSAQIAVLRLNTRSICFLGSFAYAARA